MYEKWKSYDVCGSWDMERDRHNFLSFWTIFCPFTPLTTQKTKILKKWKKNQNKPETAGDIISQKCTINGNRMMYDSWDMKRDRQNFLSFRAIFCPFTPLQPKKSKFWKNEKNIWRYHHFTHVYNKWKSYDVWFLRYGVQQTEFFLILDHFLPFYPP